MLVSTSTFSMGANRTRLAALKTHKKCMAGCWMKDTAPFFCLLKCANTKGANNKGINLEATAKAHNIAAPAILPRCKANSAATKKNIIAPSKWQLPMISNKTSGFKAYKIEV